jgi:conjugative relaxase-like TrwC/TraI family protein
MLTISKALSAGQARTYHAREFVSEKQNYWSRDAQVHSEWQGRLAQEWGLRDSVGAEEFARLSEGQHPESGAQLVKHQPAKTYDNEYGKEITSVEHRAGWDATFSAPKSVSLTALVGNDERVRQAHRESVRMALGELERYAQARIGNIHAPETTAKFIAATFEHDTARPVDGLCCAATSYSCCHFQYDRAREWPDAGASGAKSFPVATVCDQRVSFRACHAAARDWL